MDAKSNKRKLSGKVIKLSSEKTIKVRVERKYPHPKYGKIIKEHKNYLVNIEDKNAVVEGDLVEIQECRPFSRNKTWEFTRKLND